MTTHLSRRFVLGSSLAAALLLGLVVLNARQAPDGFDVLIVGGRIVDGTGAPWFRADLGIRGDRIAEIGALRGRAARQQVDATGLVVAPGFIDMLGQSEFNVLVDGRAASKIMQGITTEITGEGSSIAPVNDRMMQAARPTYEHFGVAQDFRTLAEYFTRLETRSRSAINVGTFVGAGGVRDYVLGREDRRATAAELAEMRRLVARAMEEGALGLSTSLQYVPDRFASTEEIVELAKEARRFGGVYLTHQRSEGGRIFESLDEVFTVAEKADIPSDLWPSRRPTRRTGARWPRVLRKFEEARARGLDVTANQYPYTRASNNLDACLPLWAREGGVDAMLARLKDPALLCREESERPWRDAGESEKGPVLTRGR